MNCYLGKPAYLHDTTNPDWVPSKEMGYIINQIPDEQRHSRLESRKRRRSTMPNPAMAGRVEDPGSEAVDESSECKSGVACQATVELLDKEAQTSSDGCAEMREELALIRRDNQSLLDSLLQLKHNVSFDMFSFTAEFLENNEEKLKFYTGKLHGYYGYLYKYHFANAFMRPDFSCRYSRVVCF